MKTEEDVRKRMQKVSELINEKDALIREGYSKAKKTRELLHFEMKILEWFLKEEKVN